MDHRLVTAARAVKARQRRIGRHHPVLWLFTDRRVLPDPAAVIARLPPGRAAPGLMGVVFRDDDAPDRAGLGRRLARLCRARRIAFVVAGDARLARLLAAGLHARALHARAGPRQPTPRLRAGTWRTASAHDARELRLARRRGADVVFLSPAFATGSHPGAPSLRPARWARLARGAGPAVLALGGVTGANLRRLGRRCAGYGAIRALG